MLSILKGIFAVALADSVVEKTEVGAGDIIDAVRSVGGDNADLFKVIFMHSTIAGKLEKAQLLEFAKYTDPQGIERKTNIAYWGSRLVIVNDLCPVIANPAVYELTADEDIVSGKDYYTRSGSEGSYVYTKVASPVKTDLGTYYEKVSEANHQYVCYVLGANAFCYQPLPMLHKTEMDRDILKHGGETILADRERFILAPEGISFVKPNVRKISNSVLETGSNWEIVHDVDNNELAKKAIPFAKLVYTFED